MQSYKYIYGPVPSRRMGSSVGISPLPKKSCNYSCIYCQLGRTDRMTNTRQDFFPVTDIMDEVKKYLAKAKPFDVITIVGEGEPTLYLSLGELIKQLQKVTDKPIAVITNGALLSDKTVQDELMQADIVLPSIDFYDEASFKKINRPHRDLSFKNVIKGLIEFSSRYQGNLWLETMIIDNLNDDSHYLKELSILLSQIQYDKLYINTPIRPPAEKEVNAISSDKMDQAIEILKGISIDRLVSEGFCSEIEDHYDSILSIISRHPMNQFEINTFLLTRECANRANIMDQLNKDPKISCINYKGYLTYRLK